MPNHVLKHWLNAYSLVYLINVTGFVIHFQWFFLFYWVSADVQWKWRSLGPLVCWLGYEIFHFRLQLESWKISKGKHLSHCENSFPSNYLHETLKLFLLKIIFKKVLKKFLTLYIYMLLFASRGESNFLFPGVWTGFGTSFDQINK